MHAAPRLMDRDADAQDLAQLADIELKREAAETELDRLHASAWALAVAPGAMPNPVTGPNGAMTGPIQKWRDHFEALRRTALERSGGQPSRAAEAAAAALAALDAREAALTEPPPGPPKSTRWYS